VDSILTSVKKVLGIDEEYVAFDVDILLYINSVLAVLNQIGVGPTNGFQIEDKTATWTQFLAGDETRLNNVKGLVCLRVRLLFDPPATSFAIKAIEDQIREHETRLYIDREAAKWELTNP
jgi:hypothetical protein